MSRRVGFRGLLAVSVVGGAVLLTGCDVDKQGGRTITGGTPASNPGPAGVGGPGGSASPTGTTGVSGSTYSSGATGTPGTGQSGTSK